jgi:hypothetical protein
MNKNKKPAAIIPKTTVTNITITNTAVDAKNTMPGA